MYIRNMLELTHPEISQELIMLREAFQHLDMNGDGSISLTELKASKFTRKLQGGFSRKPQGNGVDAR